jgi:hypothetical protein
VQLQYSSQLLPEQEHVVTEPVVGGIQIENVPLDFSAGERAIKLELV